MRELLVPLGVIAIVASMLLPLPPGLVDFLLIGNLLAAGILLISALYLTEPLKMSALPTLLLLATLARLSLNVTTTRLILSTGDAGRAIEAFGSVVIQGNLIVGMVVFLIITLIQFIVIAKGSERVAEVCARFTLDALPGKQMSIDADLRAGLMDVSTARQKRRELQTESKFYGALDGAMKFIKGDAIAGIIIVAINIVGGLMIGVLIGGLDISSALHRYTLLTVGEGLLSQIPALLNSLAAGMVVTRVSGGDETTLSTDVFNQLGQFGQVKLIIGTACFCLCFVEGMPWLPLISLGVLLVLSGLVQRKSQQQIRVEPRAFKPTPPPLLSVEIAQVIGKTLTDLELRTAHDAFLEEVYKTTGLLLPQLVFLPKELKAPGITIRLRGIELKTFETNNQGAVLIQEIFNECRTIVKEQGAELVDDIMTRRLLDALDPVTPELVSAVIPTLIGVTQLSEILRALVEDGITVRNLDQILQAVAEHGGKAGGERGLLEEVRIFLKRVISQRYQSAPGALQVYTLDPALDLALVQAERGEQVPAPDVMERIERFLEGAEKKDRVLAVSKGARRLIAECLNLRGVKIPVLAFEEIVPSFKITLLDCVTPSGLDFKPEELAA